MTATTPRHRTRVAIAQGCASPGAAPMRVELYRPCDVIRETAARYAGGESAELVAEELRRRGVRVRDLHPPRPRAFSPGDPGSVLAGLVVYSDEHDDERMRTP
ncbi:hypothetical protein [Nonomuraea salmonea]|uniref:Uncharacterized protein n=1 Tax=Nonomuraea salmonea TaxID=46181 RepID=A0ABV5P2T6_9ACTN